MAVLTFVANPVHSRMMSSQLISICCRMGQQAYHHAFCIPQVCNVHCDLW